MLRVKQGVCFLDVAAELALVLVLLVRQSTGDVRKGNELISKANSVAIRQSPGQRALGLFAAVWLNLALAPCAMAMEADHDCPHCPPAHEHEMAGHHGHGTPTAKAPCASLDTPCGDLDDVSLDGRAGQPKVKDFGDLPVAIVPGLEHWDTAVATTTRESTGPPRWPGRSTPLHVLHCVYLK